VAVLLSAGSLAVGVVAAGAHPGGGLSAGARSGVAAQVRPPGPSTLADVAAGRQLFLVACTTCHGKAGEGVGDRGPSLIGVGAASGDTATSICTPLRPPIVTLVGLDMSMPRAFVSAATASAGVPT